MYIFVLRLRNLIKLHGNVWARLMYILGGEGAAGSEGGWAARGSSRCHLAPGQGFSQPLPLRLRSRGNVPSSILRGAALSPRAHQPCASEPGAGLPPRTGTQGRLSGHLALAGRL